MIVAFIESLSAAGPTINRDSRRELIKSDNPIRMWFRVFAEFNYEAMKRE